MKSFAPSNEYFIQSYKAWRETQLMREKSRDIKDGNLSDTPSDKGRQYETKTHLAFLDNLTERCVKCVKTHTFQEPKNFFFLPIKSEVKVLQV